MNEQGAESLTSRVLRGVGLAGSGYALTQAIILATYLVLARLTTPLAFGQYAEAAVLVGVGLLFTESGMLAALIQRRDRVEEAANTALLATLASGIAVSLLALAAAPLIGLFFRSDTVGAVAAAIAGQLFLRSATVVPNAMLERRLAFLRRTVVEPLAALAFAAAAIIAMSNGMGVWGLVIGNYVQIGVDAALTWALARWRPRPRLASLGMWRELVRFGRHVIAAGVVQRVGEQADRVLVGRFVGTAALGQYQYALRLAMAPFEATLAVASHVLFPAFARISHDRDRLSSAYLRSLRWVMVVSMPASLILFPLGEPLAVILFGEVWRPAGQALMAMCLFAAGNSLSVDLSRGREGIRKARRTRPGPLGDDGDHGRARWWPSCHSGSTGSRMASRWGPWRGAPTRRSPLSNRVDAGGANLGRGVGPGSRCRGDGGGDLPDRAFRRSRQHPRGRRGPGPAGGRGAVGGRWSTWRPYPAWLRTAAG